MLDTNIQNGLAVFYLLAVLLNVGLAAHYWFKARDPLLTAVWGGVALLFLIHAGAYAFHAGWVMPKGAREAIDWVMGPVVYVSLSVVAFVLLLVFRRFFVLPTVALAVLNASFLFGGWAMTDSNFRAIVAKEDNVPITMLIYSVGFFTWLGLYRAVRNDDRLKNGQPVLEKTDDDKVLVWPDLVYTEMICMVICTVILLVWAILLKAPLEQPATSAKAPNPSKAPWYFLGLQEMLVYFDPWMAGVVLPTMIIVGLMAMPYIDFNREGNGYFTFSQRPFAVSMFLFGFIVLWVVLIVLGTFLRGPNWNFFGPFEYWDPHKVVPLNNVFVSQIFWLNWLGIAPSSFTERFGPFWGPLIRESPGILLVLGYLFLIPPLLARTFFRSFFIKMGFVRYMILMNLLLFMAALPIKMVLRWTFNLKYIVAIPEIFFNI
jgi:hypothetical protein